jgi:hypothetical protein
VDPARTRVLETPPAEWDDLLASDPNATPAHRPAVWRALCETREGMTPRFVAVEDERGLLGGAPLVIERRAGLHWIHALPFVLPGAPLARREALPAVDAAVGEAIAALQSELPAVGGEWSLYRPEGPEIEPASLERPSGETRTLETSTIELLDGLEAAWRRVERETRYELRRARRLGLRFAEEPQELEAAYALHLGQARRWSGYRPHPMELSRRLLAPLPAPALPAGRLFTVRDARRLLGATLFLDHGREMFAWWSGEAASGRARSAMPFLYWSVADWASAAGRARLNLGGSVGLADLAAFKRSLGARVHSYPVRWLDARRGPRLGRWLAAVQERVRRRRFRGAAA